MKLEQKHLTSGSTMMAALVAANFLNFLFNSILGRALSFEDFALVTLVITFYYFSGIFTTALAGTINFKTSQLLSDGEKITSENFFSQTLQKSTLLAAGLMILWLVCIPLLMSFFGIHDKNVLFAFAPVMVLSTVAYSIIGYLQGSLSFTLAALVTVSEPLAKVLIGVLLLYLGLGSQSYWSISFSLLIASLVGLIILIAGKHNLFNNTNATHFPRKFYVVAILGGISSTLFFSLDIVMVKHFFSAELTGQYALLSLIGKMVFFFSTLLNIFTLPVVVRTKDSVQRKKLFMMLSGGTACLGFIAWLGIKLTGIYFIPLLFGEKARTILPLVSTYTFALVLFAISAVIVSYHMALQEFIFVMAPLLAAIEFTILIFFYHQDLSAITTNILWTCVSLFFALMAAHWYYPKYRPAYEKS